MADICVQCAIQDADRPELNDLSLIIVEAQRNGLVELERVTSTMWKQRDHIPTPAPSELVLVVMSEKHGELGYSYIKCLDERGGQFRTTLSAEFRLISLRLDSRWDLELEVSEHVTNSPALSISFKVYENLLVYFSEQMLSDPLLSLKMSQCLPDDDPIKAHGLLHVGHDLLQKFAITQDIADIDASVNAFEEALTLLSGEDDIHMIAGFLHDAGIAYQRRSKSFCNVEDMDKAIDRMKRALALLSNGHERLPTVLGNLGIFLMDRFEQTGDVDDLMHSIKLEQQAVDLTPDDHVDLPNRLGNLGKLLSRRFEQLGDLSDLLQAIKVQQQAVDLTPEDQTVLPERLRNLGKSFLRRFERTGDPDDIGKSIQLQQRVVDLTPEDDADMPFLLENLGDLIKRRCQRTGNLHDIQKSIQLQQQAVDLTPLGHDDLPFHLNRLGNAFLFRFEQIGDPADVEESIKLQQQAVDLTPEGHADLPSWLTSLGASLLLRFERKGDPEDLGKSIQLQRKVIELTPEGDIHLASRLDNLGASMTCRFEQSGDLNDIEQSIRLRQQALDLIPEGHIDLPSHLKNLGNSFFRRYSLTKDIHDISMAIQFHQQAVDLTPEEHLDFASRLNSLGTSYLSRFEQIKDLEDVEKSIQLHQRAVDLTPKGRAELPLLLNNLGISFVRRFQQTGDLDDIGMSIQLWNRAIDYIPEGHANISAIQSNRANSLLRLFDTSDSPEDFLLAHSNYRTSAMSAGGPPSVSLQSARKWARLSNLVDETETLAAHERVVNLIPLVAGLENTSKRRHELLTELSRDSTTAAAAALSQRQPSKAVEWLEAGRCVVWNQINQLRTPLDDLRTHHPELADHLRRLSTELEQLGSRADPRQPDAELPMQVQVSLEAEMYNQLRLTKKRKQLLEDIREIPGFESFLCPKACADLMRAVPNDGAVVIINSDDDRCDAIILVAGRKEPTYIPLDKFPHDRAKALADGLHFRLAPHEFRSRYVEDEKFDPRKLGRYPSPKPGDDVKEMLRALWNDLVDPVLQFLGYTGERADTDLPRIWWCPTGPFAFLPIHAAGIYGPDGESSRACLADYVVSSYIPTLSILDRLRSRISEEPLDGVLLISQPDTPGQSSIPNTRAEAIRTRKELEKRGIRTAWYNGEDATVARVSKSMKSYSSIHLACHASQNITNPLESAIYLHDGTLELSEIMKMDLPKADLAFLSACQTSVGARNLPEEAVHLAAGMLTAGYRSVVATMWSISDHHAPEVAETFYKCLLNDESREGVVELDITGSARALHIAVQALRRKLGYSTEDLLKWIPYVHYGI
ncbi:hypothetical protein CVT26_000990 [Gymnopilus dilepis]|uniref:CHAT domain-containing protein n=1 Tax=Gymnopilus dilepis TaxID=231916 RepID=A0A409YMK0_9AGAR|nr:hypothetical protein CVT26_000990 [Gymnopilus dilepis]